MGEPLNYDNTECKSPLFIHFDHCEQFYFYVRCKKCEGCLNQRKIVLFAKFYDRLERAFPNGITEKVHMWTLGTNFDHAKMKYDYLGNELGLIPDYYHIRQCWKDFRKVLNTRRKRNPKKYSGRFIFYVIETGDAGYHHFHLMSLGFLPHEELREMWTAAFWKKRLPGQVPVEKKLPNVNYSYTSNNSNGNIVGYMMKYMTKQHSRYYWLADLYKVGANNKIKTELKCLCGNYPNLSFIGSEYNLNKQLAIRDISEHMHKNIG